MAEPIDWDGDLPRSPRFGDAYFSAEDGLGETRAVFLTGCGLPNAWAGRRHFTVAELGFGSGLNILALLDLWRQARPSPEARLHIFSVEAYPMRREDAVRALARWPQLADLTPPMLTNWPDGRRGWRRIEWPDLNATLDLAVDEVGAALIGWQGTADAWFLDGFAPARNPEMWREEVLAAVAAKSRPGARLASFTVAGVVRRGLEAEGFAVERAPGFGRKKQRLEARCPGVAPPDAPAPRVAVLGAGIAGASLVRAFARLGVSARVFDPGGIGAGASGNPAALVTPRLDAGLGAVAVLHAQAFARAVQLYRTETPDAIIAEGAAQLEGGPRDASRYDRIAAWDGFADGAVSRISDPAPLLHEGSAPGALWFSDALTAAPHAILSAWLGDGVVERAVERIEPAATGWRLVDTEGETLMEADVVVLAAGAATTRFAPSLRLRPVRGQISLSPAPFVGAAAAWGGYAIPTRSGVLFGATHDRDDAGTDLRETDHQHNLTLLRQGRPDLAALIADEPLDGRAAVRAATPDHSPLAGAVPGMPGVFVLSGLGGRGFTLAPLLAEKVAAEALGLPTPLPGPLAGLVEPGRQQG